MYIYIILHSTISHSATSHLPIVPIEILLLHVEIFHRPPRVLQRVSPRFWWDGFGKRSFIFLRDFTNSTKRGRSFQVIPIGIPQRMWDLLISNTYTSEI